MLTPYQFASNRPIDEIDLDGLEYLRADEARIKVIGGKVHINLDNFNSMIRGAWHLRNQKGNWPAGHIGWPTTVGEVVAPDRIKSPESVHLDNGLLANDPTYIPGQHKVQNPIAASTNKVDRRFKNRTISGLAGGAKGAAGFALALNSITWGLEQYGIFAYTHDMNLVEEHLSLLQIKVVNDINEALDMPEMIPDKYRNAQDLGGISNVVLSGVNPTNNQEIYDIGIRIVKEISKNFRYPLQIHHYNNNQELNQMDKTRIAPKVFPKYNEK